MKKIREMSMGKKALALIVALALLLAGIPMTVTALDQTLTCESVSVTGNFPDGAELLVTEVHNADDYIHSGTTILFAYDIKIMADGVEWQPDEPVLVSIEDACDSLETVQIVHINEHTESGIPIAQAFDVEASFGGNVQFPADSFSYYIGTVVTGGNNVELTPGSGYAFYSDAACTMEISGTYEVSTAMSVYVAAKSQYVICNVSVKGVNGSAGAATVAQDSGSNAYDFVVSFPQGVTVNQLIHVAAVDNALGNTVVTFDLSYGSVLIGDTVGVDYVYSGYGIGGAAVSGVHNDSNRYVVTQSSAGAATENTITLIGNPSVPTFDVTLSGINCATATNKSQGGVVADALNLTPMETILRLQGDNHVGRVHYATGEANATSVSSLLITSASGDGSAEGSLTAVSTVPWSAAIGGIDATDKEASRNITIAGGTIKATTSGSGETGTSAIGGGGNGASDVTITGGIVTATNCGTGATIGGGGGRSLSGGHGYIIISGGVVNAANGYAHGVTIGGGGSIDSSGSRAVVTISGGEVNTTGSVGGGYSEYGSGGTATVNISGGTTVAARISGGYSGGIDLFEDATLNITGGSVDIGDRSNINSITDGNGTELYLNTVSVSGGANTPITSLILSSGEYNCEGIVADENGNIHVWLPIDVTVTSINGVSSVAIVPTATISHTSRELGAVLTAVLNNGTAVAYQWERSTDSAGTSWNAITGATYQDYTTTSLDVGKLVRVSITALNSEVYRSGGLNIYANTFVVTIPESINMVTETGRFAITNSRSGFAGKTFRVTVNPASDDFKLALQANSQQTLDYALYADAERTNSINSGGVAATFTGNGSNSVNVYYAVIDEPAYAGQYTDTLTFTVNLDP